MKNSERAEKILSRLVGEAGELVQDRDGCDYAFDEESRYREDYYVALHIIEDALEEALEDPDSEFQTLKAENDMLREELDDQDVYCQTFHVRSGEGEDAVT